MVVRVADFAYDAFGRRIERDVAGGDRRALVYDGWRVVDELGYSSPTRRNDPSLGADRVIGRNHFGVGLDEILVADRDVDGLAAGVPDETLETRLLPVTDLRGSTERIRDGSGAWLGRQPAPA